jgi:hypothetical protein
MPEKITPLSDRRAILSEMWSAERSNESLQELFEYGDIGFALAYMIEEDIVPQTLVAEKYLDDLWERLLLYFGVDDTGEYESWEEIALDAGWEWKQDPNLIPEK